MIANALNRVSMGSVSYLDDGKNKLAREVHSFARLGFRLSDTKNCGTMV